MAKLDRRAADTPKEEKVMATTVKEMLAAARATVPAISPQEAAGLVGREDVLIVDVRDSAEVQASGKIAGAINVARGMLEFRADPESPYHDPAFRKDRTLIVYCASGGRSALAGKTLFDLGYSKVRNLGAFKDWAESGGKMEKI
jgi:rhodanese-related sulfurtransferase